MEGNLTISAFVGHSFNEEDSEVVTKFCHYSDDLKDSGIGFFWENAQKAEAKIIAQKVERFQEIS